MRPLVSVLLLMVLTKPLAAQAIAGKHIIVELVSENTSVAVGKPFRIGLRIELEDEWHTYWRNAGDAGLAPTLELNLPDGFTASEIDWPYPERFGDAPEVSYGYHGKLVLPVTITPPATMVAGDVIRIGARTSWLVCKEQCIPGKAELALSLLATDADVETTQWSGYFDEADRAASRKPGKLSITAHRVDGHYVLRVANMPGRTAPLPSDVWFFPNDDAVIDHSAMQAITSTPNELTVRVPVSQYESERPKQLRGILVAPGSWNGAELRSIIIDADVDNSQ